MTLPMRGRAKARPSFGQAPCRTLVVPLGERNLLRRPRRIHETAGLMLQTPSKIPLSNIGQRNKNCRYLPKVLVEKKKGCMKTIYREL
jgi:hypothetical protein